MEFVHAQNLQDTAQTFVDPVDLIETANHEIGANRNPNLGVDRVLAGAIKHLDSEVLFDPLEEEFDLPSVFVDGGDSQCRQLEIVCQERETLLVHLVKISNASDQLRVTLLPFRTAQADALIAPQSGGLVYRSRLVDGKLRISFTADHEGGTGDCYAEEPQKIKVTTIENIDTPSLEIHLIKEVNIMHTSLCKAYEYRDRAGQIDLRMQFNCRFGSLEIRPREHREAEVYGGGIDGVNDLVEIQAVGIASMEQPSFADENMGESFVSSPVPVQVGVSEVCPRDVATHTHAIEVWAFAETSLNVAKALTESELGEEHREELVAGAHGSAGPWHRVEIHAALELLSINDIGYLGEN